MSNFVKISIEGQLLDLPPSFNSLKLTYALRDRQGIAVNKGSKSEYSFELPATKQNDIVFGQFWDVGRLNPNEQKFRKAEIEVDGLTFFQGKAQLTAVTTQDGHFGFKGKTYKVAFYGNNIDWVQDIREKKLYEYDLGTHTFDQATVIGGYFINTYPTYNYGYCLVKWKDFQFSNRVAWYEFTPFIFVKAFVDSIFTELGYTIDSTFMDTEYFKQLIMPVPLPPKFDNGFGEDYMNISANDTYSTGSFPASTPIIPLTNQTVSPLVGSNPYNTTTGVYTVPFDGFYKFTYRANIYNVTGSIGLVVGVSVTSGGGTISVIGDSSSTAYTANTNLKGEVLAELSAGDTVVLTGLPSSTLGSADIDFSLEVLGEAKVVDGVTIDFKYLIPKGWGALDFIKGLSHAFNLVFQTNEISRTVTIEPTDNYNYTQTTPSLNQVNEGFYNDTTDLTNKLDLLKQGQVKNDVSQAKSIRLAWKVDGQTEEAINQNQDIGLLEGVYNMPIDRYIKDQQTIVNPFFALTMCIIDNSITHEESEEAVQIPLIWPTNYLEENTATEADYNIQPRILIKDNRSKGNFRNDDGAGGYTKGFCPNVFMIDYSESTGRMPLSFGNVTINGTEIKGLLDRFYLREMKRLEVGKELETYVSLDLLDILNLDFRKRPTIKDTNYILQEVNSFDVLSEKSTKTYFKYNAPIQASDSDKIDSPSIDNKIVS